MRRLLLDTHVFLWMQTEPARLGPGLAMIEDIRREVLLSSISSWEIAIKWALGKLALPEPPATYVPTRMSRSATTGLPLTHAHALEVGQLPPHHVDPFDRALVAQARIERIPLITADREIRLYDVEVVWVG